MKKLSLLLIAGLFAACEQYTLPDEIAPETEGNLTVSIYQLEQSPFESLTRATDSEVCTRLNFAIYDLEGTRLEQINQKAEESGFGTASFQLDEGNYQLVALAHSSKGNPTMTNPAKIQFTNATGYTDTFLYHTSIAVTDEPQTLSLTLNRIVSLCRFVITDAIPEGVTKLRFNYTGGSGAFDAATGLGSVKSTQKLEFDVQEGDAETQYDLYTFLHNQEGTIKLNVTALDADENVYLEREFNIAMERNQITTLTGAFFVGTTPSYAQSVTATVTLNTPWENETEMTY